ncbi:MAG TPA: flagellar motor switch protein FliM [Verrucomicrobiae bacterium]|nr:flagellar motor switch protein FliM [Verrucomicrobiae bacterium]
MSPILSEEEVDALLRGVREGAVPGRGSATASGVHRLDLTSQERNLRGRLPGLELVVDRFVRGLRTSLGALLGHAPDLDVRSLELLKFARVTARFPQPVGLGVFRMPPLRGQGLLVVTPTLVSALLQVFCGGAPARTTPVAGRDLSAIEQRVLERLGARVLHDLKEAFRPLAAIEFGALRTETNPIFAAIAGPQDLVALLELAVGIGGLADPGLWLCLPNAALHPLRHRLQAGPSDEGEVPDAGFGDRMRAALATVELEVTAELGTHRMRLRDVLGLRKGDVLPLRTGREGPVLVRVEGRPRFLAAPGLQGGRNAVRVTARI